MKPMAQFVFFAVILAIFGSVNLYVYIRGLQAIGQDSSFRNAYIVLFWTIAASFFAGRTLENYWSSFLSDLLIWVGSFWFAALLYFLLSVVLLDILRIFNHFLPFFPASITENYPLAKRAVSAGIVGLVGLLLIAGHINSILPQVTTLNLSVGKKAGNLKKLNIVAASDIHLGTIVGRSRLVRIVNKINSLNPDVVLLPGDIVDEDLTQITKNSLGEPFREIRSRFGVYASTGNHEYYGGIEKASTYLTSHDIILLRDQAIKVADSFYLVGREDIRFGGQQRKKLLELMKDVDKSYAVIMMDHQPFGLKEAAECGVDLQLSGHTHYGQIWPLNYIVRSIFELAWGYRKIGDTHYYVSNGAGTWGPPVRIGNRPEIVNIRLEFE
jgi:predicted MPP superfamily phosphohydrolase